MQPKPREESLGMGGYYRNEKGNADDTRSIGKIRLSVALGEAKGSRE
jgi:hypothetical protein